MPSALPVPTPRNGSLLVVGTGIGLAGRVTVEAQSAIAGAERLYYVAPTPAMRTWIAGLNPKAVSLSDCYAPDQPREVAYVAMTERLVTDVRAGHNVVAAFYGHPGIGVEPGHAAIRLARQEGFSARMLPGVSADACLYADLAVDPLTTGVQSYDGSAFVVHQPQICTRALLLLWQVGVIGWVTPRYSRDAHLPGLERLTTVLLQYYTVDHEVTVYEAAALPIFKPTIERGPLHRLCALTITPTSTLVIPPRT